MTPLSKEEIVLSSNDNSITLTTHRVMQKTSLVTKEMFLKDILSHEVLKKRPKYYLIIFIIFGVLSLILSYLYLQKSSPFDNPEENATIVLLIIPISITFFACLFYIFTYEKFLKISGKFNEIEFSLKYLSQDGLNKFLNRLAVESDNRKKEEIG